MALKRDHPIDEEPPVASQLGLRDLIELMADVIDDRPVRQIHRQVDRQGPNDLLLGAHDVMLFAQSVGFMAIGEALVM
jgi:hypothetical protein